MIEAGEDPRFIARRLMISASEDIGLADPTALPTAVAAAEAVALIGLPEARINLAQAAIDLALAPKSNAVIAGGRRGPGRRTRVDWPGRCRRYLRDAHYKGGASSATAQGYVYPHDVPGAVAAQQYAPDAVAGRSYYEPTRYGAESRLADLWDKLRTLLRS